MRRNLISLLSAATLSIGLTGVLNYDARAQERSEYVKQDGNSQVRRPLDLPSGGNGNDDEEDESESIIFYGAGYEGDAFFWCLDRSCSMGWGSPTPLSRLKQETNDAINQLSSSAEFGIVSYSNNFTQWRITPQRANPINKQSAIGYVNDLSASESTCLAPAGVATVELANLSDKHKRRIFVVGDGVPYCQGVDTSQQCLEEIGSANYESIPIDTLYISSGTDGIPFMQELARQNNGQFRIVE